MSINISMRYKKIVLLVDYEVKMAIFFLILLIPFAFRFIRRFFFWDIPGGLVVFIGIPGAGKTTVASYFYKCFSKRKKYKDMQFYSNVPILGAMQYDPKELGSYSMGEKPCVTVCDEAGICFNNRKFKSLPENVIYFAKMFRHYGVRSFLFFSQGLDIDITFVRLANEICIVRKSLLPFFICVREVVKYIGIDDITHQLIDCYQYKKFGMHLIFAPTCWRYFDTYDAPPLPHKDYLTWNNRTRSIL